MRRETRRLLDNRAVSPYFRAFGGKLVEPAGEAVQMGASPGNHRGEWRLLSVLVPTVVAAAVFDGLWRLGGGWLAWAGVVPGTFVVLHVLAFGLGLKTPRLAFWGWSAVLGGWSWWMIATGGATPVRWAAWIWMGFLALQAAGIGGLAWRRLMAVRGTTGLVLRSGLVVAFNGMIVLVWWRLGWPWGVSLGSVIWLAWCWGTLMPASEMFGPVAMRARGKGVLLTIDDGPDLHDTPVILDLLDRHAVKAVFFVIGEKVRAHPELARAIVARGHELGNHTLTHPQGSFWAAGPWRTRREIDGCNKAIREVTGVRPRWFRAPVGHRNFFTHPVTAELGLEVVAWSRRGFDTVAGDLGRIVPKLTEGSTDGDILLLHESTPIAAELMAAVLARIAPLPETEKPDLE